MAEWSPATCGCAIRSATWPRLYADITARNLDLDLLTRTFEFGSITGRLDVDLNGLETIAWSPRGFRPAHRNPAADKSQHRISQRAVQNLSNSVVAAVAWHRCCRSARLQLFESSAMTGSACRAVCATTSARCRAWAGGDGGFYILKGARPAAHRHHRQQPAGGLAAFVWRRPAMRANPGNIEC